MEPEPASADVTAFVRICNARNGTGILTTALGVRISSSQACSELGVGEVAPAGSGEATNQAANAAESTASSSAREMELADPFGS